MTKRISRDDVFFAFASSMKPTVYLAQGEQALLETHDCFQGQLKTEKDLISALDWNHVNPATGPVFIEGAHPGDILRIDIEEITLADQSTMVTIPGEGALGDLITSMETAVLKRTGNELLFRNIKLPVRPMIGVIGVAPAGGEVAYGTPGHHGGNMDCKLISAGRESLFYCRGTGGAFRRRRLTRRDGRTGRWWCAASETAGEVRPCASGWHRSPGADQPLWKNEEIVAAIVAAVDYSTRLRRMATHRMAHFLIDTSGPIPTNDAGNAHEPGWGIAVLSNCRSAENRALRDAEEDPGVLRFSDAVRQREACRIGKAAVGPMKLIWTGAPSFDEP